MQFIDVNGAEIFQNFPSSQKLLKEWKNAKCARFLKRPFLRLACQQRPDAWKSFDEHELEARAFRLLTRSILELYVKKGISHVLRGFKMDIYIMHLIFQRIYY